MSNLSPLAQRLVRAGAKAARPAEVDQSRIFEALRERLGDAAMVEGATAAAAQGAAGALWVKVSALTVGLGLFAGALAVTSRPTPPAPAPTVAPTVAVAAPAPAPPVPAEPQAQAPVATSAPTETSAGPSRRPADRLTQEVALLSRATSDLRSGRTAEALRLLDEHRRQFPSGVLSEERRAARAQALCALGRRSEAESELARLAQTSPKSIQAARARQVCGVR